MKVEGMNGVELSNQGWAKITSIIRYIVFVESDGESGGRCLIDKGLSAIGIGQPHSAGKLDLAQLDSRCTPA